MPKNQAVKEDLTQHEQRLAEDLQQLERHRTHAKHLGRKTDRLDKQIRETKSQLSLARMLTRDRLG